MGSYRSGRHRTQNVGAIEDYPRLDIRHFRRSGWLKSGAISIVELRGCHSSLGQEIYRVVIMIDMSDGQSPFMLVTSPRDGPSPSQRINITALPMHYGGERFYFICPISGRRCQVLPCVDGHFASRQALRLSYRSNCEGQLDRVISAREKLQAKLDPPAGQSRTRGANHKKIEGRLLKLEQKIAAIANSCSCDKIMRHT
jgi:hypothetical protein